MIVGNNIAVFVNDESGPQTSLFELPLLFIPEKFIEKIFKRVLIPPWTFDENDGKQVRRL